MGAPLLNCIALTRFSIVRTVTVITDRMAFLAAKKRKSRKST